MEKQGTKQKVLDGAVKVFAEKGFNAATTREIAAAAGVSEGSVFKYYATKRDILLSALDKVVDIFADEKTVKHFEEIFIHSGESSAKDVLMALAADRAEIFKQNSVLIKIVLTESLYDGAIAGKFYYAIRTKLFPLLHDYFQTGAREERLRSLSPEESMVAIRMLISMLAGCIFQRNYAPQLIPVEEKRDIEIMVDLFLKGLAL